MVGHPDHPIVLQETDDWTKVDRFFSRKDLPRVSDLLLKLRHLESLTVRYPRANASDSVYRQRLNNLLQTTRGVQALRWETYQVSLQHESPWTAIAYSMYKLIIFNPYLLTKSLQFKAPSGAEEYHITSVKQRRLQQKVLTIHCKEKPSTVSPNPALVSGHNPNSSVIRSSVTQQFQSSRRVRGLKC